MGPKDGQTAFLHSIFITLIKVLPSLVFFTPFHTNYSGISCFLHVPFSKCDHDYEDPSKVDGAEEDVGQQKK